MGCGEDVSVPVSGSTLRMSLTGVDPLAGGAHYEGWAIINGAPVSTGKFNVDADGAMWDLDGAMIDGEFDVGRELANATTIVLTIEPSGDVDTIPADTHYLADPVCMFQSMISPSKSSGDRCCC
jgi:hypothetical protein